MLITAYAFSLGLVETNQGGVTKAKARHDEIVFLEKQLSLKIL